MKANHCTTPYRDLVTATSDVLAVVGYQIEPDLVDAEPNELSFRGGGRPFSLFGGRRKGRGRRGGEVGVPVGHF